MSATVDLVRAPRRRPLRRRSTADNASRWPLSRVFVVGATVAAVVAIGSLVLGSVALWRLTDARETLLDRTSPAVLAAQELSVAQVDQETGVRGFVLTRQPEFLEPYAAGVQRSADALSRLRAGAAGALPEIAPHVEAAAAAEERWRTEYAEPVVAGDVAAPDAEAGRVLFASVRTTADDLRAQLDELRVDGREKLQAAASFVAWAGAVIAVTLLALLALVGFGLRRLVLRPVEELAAQVRAVVGGDPDHEVSVDGPREIRGLGEDVEAMRRHILRDLDDAQAVNRRLDEQARDLERSNRDLEQFAYVASHDLQEPLRKVSSFCQLLQRRYSGQLDDRADQYIAFAVDGAQRMQHLINDLLSFSRVGRTTEGFETVDLGALAGRAAAQLEPMRDEAGGEVVIGELPTVAGDPGLLQALLVNLIGNGLKFRREDVPPRVEVASRRDGDSWEITVSDNGIGIEPEYGEKVFVLFQRLHSREVYSGTGIGLALAKKIVEFHGGRIGLVETDGPGAIVRFTLPVLDEEAST